MRSAFLSRRNLLLGASGLALLGGDSALPLLTTRHDSQIAAFLRKRPFTIAHRGSGRDWPEMTADAYSHSVAAGARALEISVARTSDGVWFGLHDATLDRTSQTTGYIAAQHTWAEISRFRVSASGTRFPAQPSRPYLRLEDFLHRYVPKSIAFVDPKAVASKYHSELITLLRRRVKNPARSIIAKSDAGNVAWARVARKAGLTTWGFYYGADLATDPTSFDQTQAAWDLVGLDWSAAPEQWAQVTSVGKIVIGHVIATPAQRAIALQRGARGIMASDLLQVGV